MRHRGVGTWALALVLAVGAANRAHGQLPAGGSQGGLITRYFKRPAAPKADKADPKEEHAESQLSPAAQLAQAQADWLRRQEVCLRLRDIAHETGDDDLWRQADQLEQRAWDAFVQQTGRGPAVPAADEAKLRKKLPANEDTSRLLGAARRSSRDAGQAALKEGRE